jgi:hypothetical protein
MWPLLLWRSRSSQSWPAEARCRESGGRQVVINPEPFRGDQLPQERTFRGMTRKLIATRVEARLPTEAEHEYSWRGGSRDARPAEMDQIVLGNLWEWAPDRYGSYTGTSAIDPGGPPKEKATEVGLQNPLLSPRRSDAGRFVTCWGHFSPLCLRMDGPRRTSWVTTPTAFDAQGFAGAGAEEGIPDFLRAYRMFRTAGRCSCGFTVALNGPYPYMILICCGSLVPPRVDPCRITKVGAAH